MRPPREGSRPAVRLRKQRRSLRVLACAAALLAAPACEGRRERPTLGLEDADSSTSIVYGVVRRARGGTAAGALVRAAATPLECNAGVIAQPRETLTNVNGYYRIELAADHGPFNGCVLLDVDFDRFTIRPDTTVTKPGVRFRRFAPPRDSVRVDVTVEAR